MKKYDTFRMTVAMLALVGTLGGSQIAQAAASETGTPPFSSDPAVSASQRAVYAVVHQYETALNAKDTKAILDLFANGSVAEWNGKRTLATRQQKIDAYDSVFRIAKFNTVLDYDSIDVYGDTAVVRTHHQRGSVVVLNGKNVLDYNREVFVLRKTDGKRKIVLYTFNTDAVQGEG